MIQLLISWQEKLRNTVTYQGRRWVIWVYWRVCEGWKVHGSCYKVEVLERKGIHPGNWCLSSNNSFSSQNCHHYFPAHLVKSEGQMWLYRWLYRHCHWDEAMELLVECLNTVQRKNWLSDFIRGVGFRSDNPVWEIIYPQLLLHSKSTNTGMNL